MAKVDNKKEWATLVTVGEASTSKEHPEPGDQSQTFDPKNPGLSSVEYDNKGEVLMTTYDNKSFISRFRVKHNFHILRPVDPQVAEDAAHFMKIACNNINIGYIYDGGGMEVKGGSNRVDTNQLCGCDCSELVSECIYEAMGCDITRAPYTWCGNMASVYTKRGIATDLGSFISFEETPLYTGDIMLKAEGTIGVNFSGHAALVVLANSRTGNPDELLSIGPENASDGEDDEEGSPEKKKKKAKEEAEDSTSYTIEERDSFRIEKLFEPRRRAPKADDEYYKFYQQNYGGTKNASYAWGRFSEIAQSYCTISKGQPRKWFVNTEDGYKRGNSPSLGALKSSDPGFVCVVEHIQGNYIYVSQVSLDGKFQYIKKRKVDGSWDMDLNGDGKKEYVFQGFIYNSAVDLDYLGEKTHLQQFLEVAKGQIGKGSSFTAKYSAANVKTNSWSGGFIRAVAANVNGILGVIIPDTLSCSAIGGTGVQERMGSWVDGPSLGGKPNPQVGDIALFRKTDGNGRLKYMADYAGIVCEVNSNGSDTASGIVKYKFKVIMADCDAGKVVEKTYTTVEKLLSGLYRPDWSKVDGIATSPQQIIAMYGMYTEQASVEEAAIRDLKYVSISKSGKSTVVKPSINKTGIKLCAINYTGMLANLYGAFAEMSEYLERRDEQENPHPNPSDSTTKKNKHVDEDDEPDLTSQLKGNGSIVVRGKTMIADNTFVTIYNTLRNYLHNNAGAIGIMGNMFQESGFRTNAQNSAGYAGLCQWDPVNRGAKMKQFCLDYNGEEWQTNLLGQLGYLQQELDTGYKSTRNACINTQDSLQGAFGASDYFLKNFEKPGHYDVEVPLRRDFTEAVWKLVFGDET